MSSEGHVIALYGDSRIIVPTLRLWLADHGAEARLAPSPVDCFVEFPDTKKGRDDLRLLVADRGVPGTETIVCYQPARRGLPTCHDGQSQVDGKWADGLGCYVALSDLPSENVIRLAVLGEGRTDLPAFAREHETVFGVRYSLRLFGSVASLTDWLREVHIREFDEMQAVARAEFLLALGRDVRLIPARTRPADLTCDGVIVDGRSDQSHTLLRCIYQLRLDPAVGKHLPLAAIWPRTPVPAEARQLAGKSRLDFHLISLKSGRQIERGITAFVKKCT